MTTTAELAFTRNKGLDTAVLRPSLITCTHAHALLPYHGQRHKQITSADAMRCSQPAAPRGHRGRGGWLRLNVPNAAQTTARTEEALIDGKTTHTHTHTHNRPHTATRTNTYTTAQPKDQPACHPASPRITPHHITRKLFNASGTGHARQNAAHRALPATHPPQDGHVFEEKELGHCAVGADGRHDVDAHGP
jgi:hypothetical protein